MSDFQTRLKSGFSAGVKKGWDSFVWICKIVIPVSFLVTLLQWTGWLNQLDFLLNPLMSLLNLPPEAVLPIISGMLINIYVVIAMITVLPFSVAQMTLIAIFTQIAHNLIMEGIIQHKAGINVIKVTLIRIVAAIVTVLAVSPLLGDTSQSIAVPAELIVHGPLLEVLRAWGIDILILLAKILGIIIVIMIVLESLKSLDWIKYLLSFFQPLMVVLGLPSRTAMMWVAAFIFGLLYGGAVIVEESKAGDLTKDELERLHISAGISHAMVEDPLLFAVLGLNPLWLWVPRFIAAIIGVQVYNAISYLNKKTLGRWLTGSR